MEIPEKIQELHRIGQSVWLDYIDRQMLQSAELERLRDLGVSGVTDNPTIFEKAVTSSDAYTDGMRRLFEDGRGPEEVIWDLLVEDVTAAADVLRPVYDAQDGRDGFVSIEVSPEIAYDTEATVTAARDLRRRCRRPNVFVKIPATRAGLPAIRRMVAEGANINVTLIFSVARYSDVVEAFLAGLEEHRRAGGDLHEVASVASFFVSRVDTKVDKLLDAAVERAGGERERGQLIELRGKAGIANSRLAYRRFLELHSGPRWESLARDGARVQRCLWASTSTKDPRFPDTMYVDELIGPETVNTMPRSTLEAFLDHGTVARTLDRSVEEARSQLDRLAAAGVDLERVTDELESEGVANFAASYRELIEVMTSAAEKVRGRSAD
jgi:transaldolase